MKGRPLKPGISFYRMDAGHTQNKKVRLLFNEFGSDGYYVWSCLLDYAYGKWGYYFDTNDIEDLEWFASEFCKVKLTTVREVISGCIRRDLFNKAVFDSFGILTCDMMQETYIIATAERRQKGSIFEMRTDWLLIDLSEDVPTNIRIVPEKKSIVPPNNSINQPNNSQSIKENRILENTRENNKPTGGAPAKPSRPKKLEKKTEVETEPYWQDLVNTWFDFHKDNKLDEPSFLGKLPRTFKQLIHLLKKRAARKKQEWTLENACCSLKYFLTLAFAEKWLKEHFTIANLVEQFDAIFQRAILQAQTKQSTTTTDTGPKNFMDTLNYLYGRYTEGELDLRLIQPEYYDTLVVRSIIPVGTSDKMPGATIEERKQQVVVELFKQKSNGTVKDKDLQPMQAGEARR